jgi:chromosomal replication initiation ATPase DnaA
MSPATQPADWRAERDQLIATIAGLKERIALLTDPTAPPARRHLHLAQIVTAVSEMTGIRGADILSVWQSAPVSRARMVAIYLALHHSPYRQSVVSRYFERDHSTVRHAIITIAARRLTDERLDRLIRSIERRLGVSGEA